MLSSVLQEEACLSLLAADPRAETGSLQRAIAGGAGGAQWLVLGSEGQARVQRPVCAHALLGAAQAPCRSSADVSSGCYDMDWAR